jgi:uncharacterized membrane protein
MSVRKVGVLSSLISGSLLLFFLPAFFQENATVLSFSFISRKFFSHVCHQIPEHSFIYHNFVFPVCARCTGIYLGLFIGGLSVAFNLLPYKLFSKKHSFFLFALPMLIDVGTTLLHLRGYYLWVLHFSFYCYSFIGK